MACHMCRSGIRFRELAKIATNFIKLVFFVKISIGYNRKNPKMFDFLVLFALVIIVICGTFPQISARYPICHG